MKLEQPFEDPKIVKGLANNIALAADKKYTFMEVCGTHTQAIGRWGLRSILPKNVRLVSGPGCPVCVTPAGYIDNACELALKNKDVIIATFGDMIRVPGNVSSLEKAQSEGADVRMLYSVYDAIKLAEENPENEIVFLAIGFETTTAGIVATIKTASDMQIDNLSFYTSLKAVPPALGILLDDPDIQLDGFLLPGHVSTIIGTDGYALLDDRKVPGAVAGFEPVDILRAVFALIESVNDGEGGVMNLYPRAVRAEGNVVVQKMFDVYLEICDEPWRGIGVLPSSGYTLKREFAKYDAAKKFALPVVSEDIAKGCECGSVLKGIIHPDECALFGKACTPMNPIGPCMVSGEGSCAAYYKYRV